MGEDSKLAVNWENFVINELNRNSSRAGEACEHAYIYPN
jgi:hypothetical protein